MKEFIEQEILCAELHHYCIQHGLPMASADELLWLDLDKAHIDYLNDFIDRWNAMEREAI